VATKRATLACSSPYDFGLIINNISAIWWRSFVMAKKLESPDENTDLSQVTDNQMMETILVQLESCRYDVHVKK
jgi:hypothetical protein